MNSAPPPNGISPITVPVLRAVTDGFRLWHEALPHIPRLTRYSLGQHITDLFIALVEAIFGAMFAERSAKAPLVQKAAVTLDALKLFLQLLWEVRAIDTKTFAKISAPLAEAGKMLGGWQKQLLEKSPPA